MFKHLIKIFILGMGLCSVNPAFAAPACRTNATFTQGIGGPTVTNLNFAASTGTLTNLVLEVNFVYLNAVKASAPLAGDFCALTYGQPGAQFRNGTFSLGTNYWTVTYGTPTKALASTDCSSVSYSYFTTTPNPFYLSWVENVTGGDTAKTKAEVFYYTVGNAYSSTSCRGTKFYIPLSIEYAIGPTNSLVVTPTLLYNLMGGCCGTGATTQNLITETGTDLTIRKLTSSCAVTAPSLYLGNLNPTVARTSGILGGVLKSTNVTLNCPNVWSGVNVTPTVTITDAGSAGNAGCNPINTAANGSSALVALYASSTILDSPAGRYCVSTYTDAGGTYTNTITFPTITSSTYSASKTLWAGLYSYPSAPSVGAVTSTLTLTVTYQ